MPRIMAIKPEPAGGWKEDCGFIRNLLSMPSLAATDRGAYKHEDSIYI